MKIVEPRPLETASGAFARSMGAGPVWSSVTTYGLTDINDPSFADNMVRVDNPTLKRWDAYRSLQPGNLNHPPASSPSWWKLDSYREYDWSSVTSYGVGDIVAHPSAPFHKFESLIPGNLNNPPASSPAAWLDYGLNTLNSYAMFDGGVQSQTVAGNSLRFNILPGGVFSDVDTIALLNVVGTSVRVLVPAISYDQNFSLVGFDGGQVKYFLVQLPSVITSGGVIYIYIENSASAAIGATAVGAVEFGKAVDLGGTQDGYSLGLTDFSVKSQDEFGNFIVVARPSSRPAQFQVWVDKGRLDRAISLIEDRRALPTLWIGEMAVATSAVWGFLKDMNAVRVGPDRFVINLEVQGLT